MQSAPLHPREPERLSALRKLELLDTEDEAALDELVELASAICDTPISLISLVDVDRQWFKAKVGLDAPETNRSVAFCSHAILQDDVFEVPNALEDARFFDNPLVTDAPDIRFYAGAPLMSSDGLPLGTLCVIDREPKKLTDQQRRALEILAKQVISQVELRLHMRRMERMAIERDRVFAVLAHDLRSPFNSILGFAKMLSGKSDRLTSERIGVMAKSILNSSLLVYQLLDELLQWTRQRLGAIDIKLEPRTLRPMLEESMEFLKDACDLKDVVVESDVPTELEVLADETLTKTIVRNLLANAIKYSPTGGTIRVSVQVQESSVQVSVLDQGPGIPQELRDGLFASPGETREGSSGETGFGLGLMLCKEFVTQQQGEIWAAEVAAGTKIIFTLPKAPNQTV